MKGNINTSKILWVIVGIVAVAMVGVFSYILGTRQGIQIETNQNTQVETEQPVANGAAEANEESITGTQTTISAKEWEKYIPEIKAKIEQSFDPDVDSIEKTEFIDITRDGIPELHITYQGRSSVTKIFYLTGSSYAPVRIEQSGKIQEMVATFALRSDIDLYTSMFLSNSDLCIYKLYYELGTNESQFTWNKNRQMFVETTVNKECKDTAFAAYKSFVLPGTYPIEKMKLIVHVKANNNPNNDCSATKPIEIEVPKTNTVLDASLRYLFIGELAQYGAYESVKVANGIAQVFIYEKMNSYSSCESGHLRAIIENTLTQYPSVKKVELYRVDSSNSGMRSKIKF